MSSLLIPATKSLTVTNRIPNGNINEDTILVGSDENFVYFSYLFFDTSVIPKDSCICSAELVLFKTNDFYNSRKEFYISPLLDYFSSYTTFNNRPRVNTIIKATFYPVVSKVAATVDLTYFVSYWFKNNLANTSIILFTKEKDILTKFGSAVSSDPYLIPYLSISTCPNVCPNKQKTINYYVPPQPEPKPRSLEYVDVSGTVAAESIYASVVNVKVTRAGTSNIDNYYVSHLYDNSLNLSDSSISATYTVAIVPPVQLGDTVEGAVFGSYKE
ncbi:DNRLRE domain-containing protein [Clostridium paridis]|uniref:DNRLRE domain-containing protein n=1 Tax=Clostridium paridis TaxID=2803863 RepID=A0A937K6B3_9CLOT|nr:DNRLRE domain-containing protein [Clostridium paridis]MBL4933553.1 DNRLRE domain-containing protein [Clostridium paridis]